MYIKIYVVCVLIVVVCSENRRRDWNSDANIRHIHDIPAQQSAKRGGGQGPGRCGAQRHRLLRAGWLLRAHRKALATSLRRAPALRSGGPHEPRPGADDGSSDSGAPTGAAVAVYRNQGARSLWL